MKYTFRKIDFWEELRTAIGDISCNVIDSGDEITFDFGDRVLTTNEEATLTKLLSEKPMLRGKRAKFVGKGNGSY
jgi:hypothetical protein